MGQAADARDILQRPKARRVLRFLAVGALNAAFGYALFALFIYVGLLPEFALLIATVIGVWFNFITTGNIVFRDGRKNRLVGFVAIYVFVYFVNATAIRLLIVLSVQPLLAQLVLLPCAAALTYLALQRFVYRTEP